MMILVMFLTLMLCLTYHINKYISYLCVWLSFRLRLCLMTLSFIFISVMIFHDLVCNHGWTMDQCVGIFMVPYLVTILLSYMDTIMCVPERRLLTFTDVVTTCNYGLLVGVCIHLRRV
jgi:hypothetical protein